MLRSFRTLLLALPLALGACGSTATAPTIETATFAPSLGVNLATSTRLSSGVYYRDVTVGTGAVVANGQLLQMRYAGFLTNGSSFDANAAPQTPFSFTIGSREVISGWDQGVVGMRVGGRRQLIIPPAFAYGSNALPGIPANSILVFNVEVVGSNAPS